MFHSGYYSHIDTLSAKLSTRELRSQLTDFLGRTMHGGERIGATRDGSLTAVIVSVSDLEALENFEMQQDAQAFREAKATDEGERKSLEDLRSQLD